MTIQELMKGLNVQVVNITPDKTTFNCIVCGHDRYLVELSSVINTCKECVL
jgi:transcription elongation factor Elf1